MKQKANTCSKKREKKNIEGGNKNQKPKKKHLETEEMTIKTSEAGNAKFQVTLSSGHKDQQA